MRFVDGLPMSARLWRRVERWVRERVDRDLVSRFVAMPVDVLISRSSALNARRFPSETWFIQMMRERNQKLRLYRNSPLCNRFFGDFVNHNKMLVIEIDGASHAGKFEYDSQRDLFLSQFGYRVLRLKQSEWELWPWLVDEFLKGKNFKPKPIPLKVSRTIYSKSFLKDQLSKFRREIDERVQR